MADQFILDLIGKLNKELTKANIEKEFNNISTELSNSNKINLVAGLDTTQTKNKMQTQLDTITKGLRTGTSKSTNIAGNLFNSAELDKQGRHYEYKVTNIIDRIKSYYLKQGALKVDVANVQNANGKIQSFTATVEQSTGVIQKFNYEYGKINNPKNTGYIQTNTVGSIDKNAGANLKSTINLLNQVERQIANVNSKTLNMKNPLQAGTPQFDTYKKAYDEIIAKVENLKNANKSMTSAQKAELQTLANAFKNLAREQQASATGATKLDASSVTASVEKSTASLQVLEEKWKQQGILVGDFKSKVEALKTQLNTIGDAKGLSNYSTQFSVISSEAQKLYLIQTGKQKEVNALLDKQTVSLNNINRLRVQIATEQGKTNNQSTVAELNRQLTAEQQIYKTIQQEMTQYSSLINNEQRRADLKNATATAENKIKLIQSGQSDRNTLNLANQSANIERTNSQLKVLSNKLATAQSKFQAFTGSMKSNAVSQFRGEIVSVNTAFEKVKMAMANGDKAGAERYFREATSAATKFRTEMVSAGNVGISMFDRLIKNVRQFSNYLLSATTVMLPLKLIRGVIDNVKELDKALVDIQMATGGTYEETAKLVQSYSELGQKLGATTTEVADSATEWLRQGKSIEDTNTLIYDTMVLSKVGMIDSSEATEYLTSAMKGYQVSVSDTLGIVDKLTAVDMEAAVSAGGLAEGMSRVANIANLSGVSMDKLIGYLTTVSETSQKEMSEVGNSFQAIFSRMGNIKAGKFVDEESGENLNDVAKVLNKVGIDLFDAQGQFRNFGTVLDEVAGKWDTYDTIEQNAISTAIAGKQKACA